MSFLVSDLAQFIAAAGVSQPQQIVQVSDVGTPIIQVQDAIANGTIIQVVNFKLIFSKLNVIENLF